MFLTEINNFIFGKTEVTRHIRLDCFPSYLITGWEDISVPFLDSFGSTPWCVTFCSQWRISTLSPSGRNTREAIRLTIDRWAAYIWSAESWVASLLSLPGHILRGTIASTLTNMFFSTHVTHRFIKITTAGSAERPVVVDYWETTKAFGRVTHRSLIEKNSPNRIIDPSLSWICHILYPEIKRHGPILTPHIPSR